MTESGTTKAGSLDRPTRVAVIGSGCAAMTTAYELSHPRHQGQYDVTVYQLGWRSGGKGASGRGVNGRIEEHGLHLWMGHYDNAFALMRECYAELGRDAGAPLATFEQAFIPDSSVGVTDHSSDGWTKIMAEFPPVPGMPGDPIKGGLPRTTADYMVRTVQLLAALLESAHRIRTGTGADAGPTTTTSDTKDRGPALDAEGVARLLKLGRLATLGALSQAITSLEHTLRLVPSGEEVLGPFVELIRTGVRRYLDPLLEGDAESRFLWQVIDVVLAHLRGCVRFNVMTDPRGFEAVDHYDVREWLLMNGADERSADSAFVRGLYDLVFGYENGDPNRPALSAGLGIRCGLRMFFGYRGALFWKMQAGMGDVVFAPLYEVMQERGVRFEFFHRLENIGLADPNALGPGEQPYVSTLEISVQALMRDSEAYRPLVDIKGLPCWPSEPDWDQLVDGEQLRAEGRDFEAAWDRRSVETKVLEVGKDFDFAVLGVGLGAVPEVAKELIATNKRWRDMVENLGTVATQAFQVWLDADLEELGWHDEPPNLSGFVEPFDTWADMSHLAKVEDWPTAPKSIAYFCNVLPEKTASRVCAVPSAEQARESLERVKASAIGFLNRDIVHIWSRALDQHGEFRWKLLMLPRASDQATLDGEARFETQFVTANVNPTDRYVQSLPGTAKFRISPLDETYDNFTIAGDWTDCGFNLGCVEAAVMSGRLAAHALCCWPPLEDIIGFDHV